MKDKEPLHFLEEIKSQNGSISIKDRNSYRDELFTKNGWTVIRFSEDQILTHAKECIDLIELIVNYWYDGSAELIKIEDNSFIHGRWKLDDSIIMAKKCYRELNVNKKLFNYLQKEKDKNYDSEYNSPTEYASPFDISNLTLFFPLGVALTNSIT